MPSFYFIFVVQKPNISLIFCSFSFFFTSFVVNGAAVAEEEKQPRAERTQLKSMIEISNEMWGDKKEAIISHLSPSLLSSLPTTKGSLIHFNVCYYMMNKIKRLKKKIKRNKRNEKKKCKSCK